MKRLKRLTNRLQAKLTIPSINLRHNHHPMVSHLARMVEAKSSHHLNNNFYKYII
jgi:hypothetical protein